MARLHEQLMRQLALVAAAKQGGYPNAESMARELSRGTAVPGLVLACCAKTIKRDITVLREEDGAALRYDRSRHGYCLMDSSWTFPLARLAADELFGRICRLGSVRSALPPLQRASLGTAMAIDIGLTDPRQLATEVLLILVPATSRIVPAREVVETVARAWRETRGLRVHAAHVQDRRVSTQDVDVHAMCLAEDTWLARAYCHLPRAMRSLPLHQLQSPQLLDARFVRSAAATEEVRQGHVFNYDLVRNVTVRCDAERAPMVREREWFPGQALSRLPGGGVELRFPAVNRAELVWWVLSHGGHLEVRAPDDLRQEIRTTAERLLERHRTEL